MEQAASYDLLVITDSDVQVRKTFLEEVVAPFADPEVGASTCLYVGAASNMGIWALLEGLGMSVEMASGVLVANMLEGMHFLLGPAMMVRRSVLEKFGGFQALGYYYADDFMLGKLVADSGSTVLLSNHVIDHCIVHNSFRRNFVHQWNWMKSTRFSRPWGHFGTALTFSTPFGILGFATAMVLGRPLLAVCLLLVAYLSRVALSMIVGWRVVGDPDALRYAWLYPARDLLGFVLWVASYTSRKVGWRDDLFILRSGGLMEKLDTKASASREVGTELPAGSHHK
jgi:ceramide glucosyltransferase